MPSFYESYRELVVPVLKECCRKQGFYLAIGLIDYCDAHNVVSALAYARGGVHLPVAAQDELDKGIAETIIRYVDEFADSASQAEARADRIAFQHRKHMAKWLLTTETAL